MSDAPTLAEIAERRLDLLVFCEACRVLRPVTSPARDPATRIDALRFRCARCGAIGAPYVFEPGSATMGHARIWPPEVAPPPAPS